MGRQVPDISPEGIAQLTESYRDSVDREAVGLFFSDNPVDESVLIRWRESAGVSAAGAARLLGMSREGYSKVENGHYPIGDHFTLAMRKLLTQLDTTGFPFHPSDRTKSAPKFLSREEDYIPRKKIAAPLHSKFCANPDCSNWFYAVRSDRLYCSRKCNAHVSRRQKIDGVMTKMPRDRKEYIPLWLKCPHCNQEFPGKGNIISGTNNQPQRDSPYKTNGQAHHDGEREEPTEVR